MESGIATNGPAIPPRKHFRTTSTSSASLRTRSRQISNSTTAQSKLAEQQKSDITLTGGGSRLLVHPPAPRPSARPRPELTDLVVAPAASRPHPSIPPPNLYPSSPSKVHTSGHTTYQSSTTTTTTISLPVASSARQLQIRTSSQTQRDSPPSDPASPTSPTSRPGHAASNSVGSIKDSIALAIRAWSRGDSYDGNKNVTDPATATATPGRRHSRVASLSRRLSIGGTQSLLSAGNLKDAHQFHPLPLDTSPKKERSHRRNSKSLSSLIQRGPSPLPQPKFDSSLLNGRSLASQSSFLEPPQNPNTLSAPPAQARDNSSTSPSRRRHSRQPSATHSLRKLSQANDSVEKLHRRRSSVVAVALPIQIPDPVSPQPNFGAQEEKREGKVPTSRQDKGGEVREEGRVSKMEVSEDDGSARRRQEKEKKAMLSRALQKAHAAVVLDNEQSFEGAIDAYSEACQLLQQVLLRSTAEEDQAKLDAIRSTYENRIFELQQMNPELGMPRQMLSSEVANGPSTRAVSHQQDAGQFGYSASVSTPAQSHTVGVSDPPPFYPQQSQQLDPRMQAHAHQRFQTQPLPLSRDDHTPLVASRYTANEELRKSSAQSNDTIVHSQTQPLKEGHSRDDSTGAMSWLDTIDESGQSSIASSPHSHDDDGLHRRKLRAASGGTEAEFNAAMDAAVEAAYGGEMEPYDDGARRISAQIKSAKANVHLAKERVKEVEREEAILAAQRRTQLMKAEGVYEVPRDSLDEEGEEEERMLEQMTKELMGEEYNFGLGEKSGTVPRQSDSSEFSGSSAWHSSMSSSRTTAATTLSAGADDLTGKSGNGLPRLEEEGRPSEEFQQSPERLRDRSLARTGEDIRSRRLSGQPSKQLFIETAHHPSASAAPPPVRLAPLLKTDAASLAVPHSAQSDPRSAVQRSADSSQAPSYFSPQGLSPHPIISPGSAMTISPATPDTNLDRSFTNTSQTSQGTTHRVLSRKNKSNVSLNGSKMHRTFSASSPDESEPSTTPLSQHFYGLGSNGSGYGLTPGIDQVPALPAFPADLLSMMQTEGSEASKLFFSTNDDTQPLDSPDATSNAPSPLEPCPESYLLRPFWLMRAVFQTLAHPRGGYISTKLFVPRDVWRVKGVKIKGVDDKISTCDLLTEALRRLGTVDTLDADAVLDEMQRLENILEQAQLTLTKKLGSEVGVQSIHSLFKDAPASMNTSLEPLIPGSVISGGNTHSSLPAQRSTSQSKGYLSSWRKLRSKSSAVGLASSTGGNTNSNSLNSSTTSSSAGMAHSLNGGTLSAKDIQNKKISLTMATLPMTSLTSIRFAKRDLLFLDQGSNDGPHAAYVACLARLFDAVQIVDQIARQVEDPGLKFSSSTHVGLELCTRHAAEFFGFYVCRFVLSDLGLLLDKFIKRGSEWVLV